MLSIIKMKFSLDFDGIFTDESQLDLSVVNKEWFYWSEYSIMYSPIRKGVRQVASLFQYFGDVIITTARPFKQHKSIRNWLMQNAPELATIKIVSSGNQHKLSILKSEEVSIHIDDDFLNASNFLDIDPIILIWSYESPAEIITNICKAINSVFSNSNEANSIKILSLGSSTPTFLINRDSILRKIKIFQNEKDTQRIKSFYSVAENINEIVFIPKATNWFPLLMECEFVEGILVESSADTDRINAIPLLANFLGKLHSHKIDDTLCYVSNAIDQFNVCLTTDKRIALIDLGDCLIGNKWMDIVWAEQLYCSNTEEKEIFLQHYSKNIKQAPTKMEIENALRDFYSWLHFVIASGRKWNNEDRSRVAISNHISALRATPPTDSLLFKLCK